jgi:hypothetical protein
MEWQRRAPGAELVGDMSPGLLRRLLVGLQERLPQSGRHHSLLTFGHVGERVAHPMDPGAVEKAIPL